MTAGLLGSTSSFRSSRSYLHDPTVQNQRVDAASAVMTALLVSTPQSQRITWVLSAGNSASLAGVWLPGLVARTRAPAFMDDWQRVSTLGVLSSSRWASCRTHDLRTGELMPPYSYAHGSV